MDLHDARFADERRASLNRLLMGVLPSGGLGAGLATVFGAMPLLSPSDLSLFVLDRMPQLAPAPFLAEADDGVGLERVREFLTGLAGRVDPVVMSLTGPVTVGLGLRRDGVTPEAAGRRAASDVGRRARTLVDAAHELVPDAPVVVVLDEPGLANSMHPTFPMGSREITDLVDSVADDLGDEATIGVSVNGRADWAAILSSSIRFLGAPVSAPLETVAVELSAFLDRGGVIAWGAVPTNEPMGTSTDRLWRRLSELWTVLVRAGVDPVLLRERSIITTAGDLGGFGAAQTERAILLTQDLAARVIRQVRGLRLSVGA